jgi:small-conductance mechanosensitive channel
MFVKTSHVKKSYALDGSISVTLSVTPIVMVSAYIGVGVGVVVGVVGVVGVGVGVVGAGGYCIEIIAAIIAIMTKATMTTSTILRGVLGKGLVY